MSKPIDYDALVKGMARATSFFIGSHHNPDGDGIGSTIALGIALERMNKRVTMYNRDGVPFNLKFLPNVDIVVSAIDANASFDMTIMVDCTQRNRISDDFADFKNTGEVVCVDHHILDRAEADYMLIDENAASTGEVVLHILEHAGSKICPEIAQCIYTTLVVDTGFFKYSNTSSHVLKVAGDLVDLGASPWFVAKHLEESHPESSLRLLALSLGTLTLDMNGGYSTMDITQDMLARSGSLMEYSEEFATYPRSIKGVEVSALFREVENGVIKVSMRSKDIVDVAKIAKSFGGGGHSHAAGFRMKCTLSEARKRVAKAVGLALKFD